MKLSTGLFCAMAMVFVGCASKQEKLESKIAPAAEATVTANKGDNDNTKLNIKVKHLAEANKLSEDAKQYVVWVSPEGSNTPQNVGALKVDKDLEGRHETTIPYKNFRVFVTPEQSQMASAPTGPIVFDKIIQR
jgi:hypothetical protein